MVNLPCRYAVTPFCNDFFIPEFAKSVHTKPKSRLYFNTYYIKDYVYNISGNGFDSDINDEDEKYTQEFFDDSIFKSSSVNSDGNC